MSNPLSLDEYNLSRLTQVVAREAVGGEETHFTPWLATHIDELSMSIGIGLTVGSGIDQAHILKSSTEVAVGDFRLDILATTVDGRKVVIENQYGVSDHKHLGQVITYASGIEADVVIWIAERFTEPHLAALRWLNRRTDSECGAFAVELAFFRIGDSAPAPRLTCLEEPSEWERDSRKATVAASQWTTDEFLAVIDDESDRRKVTLLLERVQSHGGRVWCGKRPQGFIHLHPLPDQNATLGLGINSKGQVRVGGMWSTWTDTYQHDAYRDVAGVLGLAHDGPATGMALANYDVDELWNGAVSSAKKLRDREDDTVGH